MSAATFRPGTARDGADLSALLAGLSPDSAYARFQTALGTVPSRSLVRALLPDGVRGRALLGYAGGVLVAHGLWVRVGPSRVAELALVVADAHQRAGIGSELAARLIDDASGRGIERIEVFSEAGNLAVARMVARHAPDADRQLDGATTSYGFAVADPERRTMRIGTPTTVSSGPRRPSAA